MLLKILTYIVLIIVFGCCRDFLELPTRTFLWSISSSEIDAQTRTDKVIAVAVAAVVAVVVVAIVVVVVDFKVAVEMLKGTEGKNKIQTAKRK